MTELISRQTSLRNKKRWLKSDYSDGMDAPHGFTMSHTGGC